jgi:hypothetical protein
VAVDGGPVLTGEDAALPASGRVGFLCHRNPAASFALAELREL